MFPEKQCKDDCLTVSQAGGERQALATRLAAKSFARPSPRGRGLCLSHPCRTWRLRRRHNDRVAPRRRIIGLGDHECVDPFVSELSLLLGSLHMRHPVISSVYRCPPHSTRRRRARQRPTGRLPRETQGFTPSFRNFSPANLPSEGLPHREFASGAVHSLPGFDSLRTQTL